MFSFVADGLTVATTVLFPIFASYKALHTSDPALLAPWLIYFVVLSVLTTFENVFNFILSWVPFYSWIRFFIHLYLIMPGSQGATLAYQEYIEPFLYQHEREIDNFITESHDRGKAAGLAYLGMAIEWVKVNVLGFAPTKPESPRPAGQTYAQNLMSRFQMPAARGSNDLYGLVNQALSGASALYTGNQSAQAAELSRGAKLVPDNIRDSDDRLNYVTSQRQRLETLLQAFDREQENLRTQEPSGSKPREGSRTPGSRTPGSRTPGSRTPGSRTPGSRTPGSRTPGSRTPTVISRNRSEPEFDRIERDEVSGRPPYPTTPPPLGRRTSSGWMPWNWQRPQTSVDRMDLDRDDPLAYGKEAGESRKARASGFDLGGR